MISSSCHAWSRAGPHFVYKRYRLIEKVCVRLHSSLLRPSLREKRRESRRKSCSAMDVSTEILRKQILVSQFVNAVGCTPDQATKILQSAQWHLDAALSLFFQDHQVTTPANPQNAVQIGSSGNNSLGSRMSYTMVPANTPATPPTLPETLAAFAQMRASSPETSSLHQESPMLHCQTQASKS